jgi:hypothetical protein
MSIPTYSGFLAKQDDTGPTVLTVQRWCAFSGGGFGCDLAEHRLTIKTL